MKKGTYRRTCTRCGVRFTLAHFVDKDGAVCTPCFNYITGARTADEYYERKKPVHGDEDCWCKPELAVLDGDNYWLHKDENGNTILTDPRFQN